MEEKENIAVTAGDAGLFTLLLAVVQYLDDNKSDDDIDLGAALTSPAADLTVFAPTDQAFADLAPALGYAGGTDASNPADLAALETFYTSFGDVALLRSVVEYHVVGGAKDASAIDAIAAEGGVLTTLGGGAISLGNFSLEDSKTELGDLDLTVANPNVTTPNVHASNGIIHIIDSILLPGDVTADDQTLSLAGVAAQAGSFKLLLEVVGFLDANAGTGDVNLGAALTDPGPGLTVFAPTDIAFANLAVTLGYTEGTDVTNSADLTSLTNFFVGLGAPTLRAVVEYHIVGGTQDAAAIDAKAAADEPLMTLGGGTIDLSNFFLSGGKTELIDADLTVTNPNVVVPNLVASNGIIHVVDNVLLPADVTTDDPQLFTITDTVLELSGEEGFDENGGDFDFLREALGATGLDEALDGEDPLTAFAPTDDAFIGLSNALGYEGDDEAGAFDYLLHSLRLLSAGEDPTDLLASVLKYHVSPGSSTAVEFDRDGGVVETLLQGETGAVSFSIAEDGVTLTDAEPDLPDQMIVAQDLPATNGIINVINGVLLPADLLQSDGSNDVDFIIGDDGRNYFSTGQDNDLIDAKGGRDHVRSGSGDDIVLAGGGSDYVNAGTGDDIVKGESGRDKILAGSGDDFVDGGSGNDWISGGFGNDTINGGEGNDWMSGGFGKDTFVFEENSGNDTIAFFQTGRDKIDLSAYGITSFDDIDIDRKGFFRSEIDLGDAEIKVNHFFFGLSEDDFILA